MNNKTSLKEQNIMIKLENINKYYQSGDEKVHALKNISLELPYQGLVFVLGQSGCGKSTLLNILGGLDKPEVGRILIEGADFGKFTSAEHNNYLNSYLGFVFQEYNILKDLNLFDNIALPLEMQNVNRKEIKRRTNEIIDLVGLSQLKKRKINQLSGGQRQRIAIARALIKNPKLIIADEPTGNLDSVTGATIFDLLKELSKDRLILVVTHDEESAYKYGDRIIKIEDGALVQDTNAPFTENDHNPLLPNTIDESIETVKVVSKKLKNIEESDNLTLTKVTAPVMTILKLALKNINNKKFRFILMMLICALSLAFFSFTIELNNDTIRQNVYTSIDNGYLYADLLDKVELPEDYVKTSIYDDYAGTTLLSGSYDKVKEAIPDLNLHEYQSVSIPLIEDTESRLINSFYTGEIQYLTKYDSSNEYNIIAGREPIDGKNEVMVTDYIIKMYEHFDNFQENLDLYKYIGKKITLSSKEEYTICGIINTNYEKYAGFALDNNIDTENKLYYAFLNEYKTINTVYLNKDSYIKETSVLMAKIDCSQTTLNISIRSPRYSKTTDISSYTVTTNKVNLKSFKTDISDSSPIGTNVDNSVAQIVVPYSIFSKLTNSDPGEPTSYSDYYRTFDRRNKNVVIEINNNGQIYELNAQIVGITGINGMTIGISQPVMEFIFNNGPKNNSFLLAEMPQFEEKAYEQFKTAYDNGYIIDLFKYREDIDTYEISPFVNLLSKAGVFVFAVFTIGILWTIISLDIVDARKEIGTFRSIGLSGFEVSLIFIFQTLMICTLSYIIALILGNIAIQLYDQTIFDSLNVIHLSMYMMTYRSPIFLVVFVIVIAFLALFLPLFKIMRQKIIDVINERGEL
ncbi:MAG: ABC transporter ATP-binding protein/permease [Bacilli bacterium]|nr:ABC transporter ATP-binding protein/permease [Bacilli bacterium]